MSKDEIFDIIKKALIDLIPELEGREITQKDSLKELGANSIDRAEILIEAMAALKLKIPLIEFGDAKNIEELVNLFAKKVEE